MFAAKLLPVGALWSAAFRRVWRNPSMAGESIVSSESLLGSSSGPNSISSCFCMDFQPVPHRIMQPISMGVWEPFPAPEAVLMSTGGIHSFLPSTTPNSILWFLLEGSVAHMTSPCCTQFHYIQILHSHMLSCVWYASSALEGFTCFLRWWLCLSKV